MPYDASPARPTATQDCLLCPVTNCLARGHDAATAAWSALLGPRATLMPGAPPLLSAGDRLQSVYSVRAGCIKTYTIDAEGNERIRGFHLPGDLIGLDALDGGYSRSTAAAVVPSQVCVAPLADLRRLIAAEPSIAQRMLEATSRELAIALAIGGGFTAEQRLAAFLLHMEQRLGARGGLLHLPMPQRDIGNYLRLATETVCRTLKHFAELGWISHKGRSLSLNGHHGLQELAEPIGIVRRPVALRLAA